MKRERASLAQWYGAYRDRRHQEAQAAAVSGRIRPSERVAMTIAGIWATGAGSAGILHALGPEGAQETVRPAAEMVSLADTSPGGDIAGSIGAFVVGGACFYFAGRKRYEPEPIGRRYNGDMLYSRADWYEHHGGGERALAPRLTLDGAHVVTALQRNGNLVRVVPIGPVAAEAYVVPPPQPDVQPPVAA